MKCQLVDLIDISSLHKLIERFNILTGIGIAILDADDILLVSSGRQEICAKFHRICCRTLQQCQQSNGYIKNNLQEGSCLSFKCLNGLMECAAPIIVDHHHIGTIIMGQFLCDPPDEAVFLTQAHKYEFDSEAYLEALRKVPIIPTASIESIVVFLLEMIEIISSMGQERKRQLDANQQTIQSYEERLNSILEEGHYGFWEMNIQSGDIFLGSHWYEIFEYAPEEIIPNFKTLKGLIHPDDLPGVLSVLNVHLQGHTPQYEAEYRIRKKSGDWKWVLVRGKVVIRDEKGNPLHIAGSVVDISKRKQTELALIESEQRYRAIVNDQNELICRFLPNGTLVFVNEAYCRYFNKTQEELLGHSFMPLIPEEDHVIIEQNIAGISMENPLASYEHRIILPSGEVRWQNWTDRAIFDHQGNIVECQSVGRDISTRKEAEEALRWSEECFRKIFETSQNLICIASLEDSTYINVNESWVRYTGYTREESIGRTTMDLNLIVNIAEFKELIRVFLENGKLDNIEMGYRTKSNQIRLARCSANLIDIGSKPCILLILTDITEHRLLEKKMGRLDQLHLVGEMAASIAHEIRNPMTTIRGFLQLFGEKQLYAEDKENIDLMIGEIDRANFIISEYLSLARNKVVNLEPESLNNIMNYLKPLILAEAVMSDKYIVFELGSIPNLLLDNYEIRQIILNLTRNGLEATPIGGKITIRTFTEGNEVVLSVADQGPGIRPEHIENLGIPFFTTKEDGTGLGLAVCYGIARRHNAIIDVKTGSTGTAFLVRFKASV